MSSKNFYLIFGAIILSGIAVIVLFVQNIFGPNGESSINLKNNQTGRDIFVTPAPDVKSVNRLPPLERKDPVIGNPDGEITIIEFADFECQYCAEVQKTLDEVLKTYPDKIRLVWKNYPLEFHSYSKKTAEAVLCANEQKKFEAMRKQLFDHQNISLLPSAIKEYGKDIGLDMTKFNTCLDGGLNEEAVNRDIASARTYGVGGVPHFFIYKSADPSGGYSMPWARKLEEFKAMIDALLKK